MIGLEYLPRIAWKPHFMLDWDHRTTRRVDHVMGAFFFVRNTLFRQLGGFDERFFVYLEDLDFSLRAKDAGFYTFYLASASAHHAGAGSTGQIKATSLYYALASRILYVNKHFGRVVATALTLGTLFLEPVSRLAIAIARRSPSQIRDTIRAYTLLWRALPRGLIVQGSKEGV
jgi:GT2 family glycosyltransferase